MKIKLPYDLGWILLVIFIIFCIFEVLIGNFHHLWGYKTVAMLDVWSIEHILSGLSVGFLSMDIINKLFGLKLEEGIKLRKKHKNGLIDGLMNFT